jgi:hypothetical protein
MLAITSWNGCSELKENPAHGLNSKGIHPLTAMLGIVGPDWRFLCDLTTSLPASVPVGKFDYEENDAASEEHVEKWYIA